MMIAAISIAGLIAYIFLGTLMGRITWEVTDVNDEDDELFVGLAGVFWPLTVVVFGFWLVGLAGASAGKALLDWLTPKPPREP